MDLSCGDQVHDFEENARDGEYFLIEDRERCIVIEQMEVLKQKQKQKQQQQSVEFWPVEHPLEPLDDDIPIKCPLPSSSSLLYNEYGRRMQEDQSRRKSTSDCVMRKRTDHMQAVHSRQGGMLLVTAPEPPVRAVRKRHHHALTSLLPSQNLTSKMLHHKLDKF